MIYDLNKPGIAGQITPVVIFTHWHFQIRLKAKVTA